MAQGGDIPVNACEEVGVEEDSMQRRTRRNSGAVARRPPGSGEAGARWCSSRAAAVRGRRREARRQSEEEEDAVPPLPIYSRGGVTGTLAWLLRGVGRIRRGPVSLWPVLRPRISDTWEGHRIATVAGIGCAGDEGYPHQYP